MVSVKNGIFFRRVKNTTFTTVFKNLGNMYSGSDIEHLFICYKAEAMPQGESIHDIFWENKLPYNLFHK